MPGYIDSSGNKAILKALITDRTLEDKFNSSKGKVLIDTLGQLSKIVPDYQPGSRLSDNFIDLRNQQKQYNLPYTNEINNTPYSIPNILKWLLQK